MAQQRRIKRAGSPPSLRRPPEASRPRRLTPRELEVLTLIAQGYRNSEIAEHLSISIKTVESHRINLKNKLGIYRPAALIKYAIQEKLVAV